MKKKSGFTLIELLIVIGIIAILAGIVIIAVNPAKQFAQANNAQRTSDVKAILEAISQSMVPSRGVLPTFVENATTATTFASATNANAIILCNLLTPNYVSAMPVDPTGCVDGDITAATPPIFTDCNTFNTNYRIQVAAATGTGNTANRITVSAPCAEDGETVSITR